MNIMLPHPMVIASCLAAFLVGYIIRWFLEENDIDIEDQIRKFFGRK